MPLVNNKWESLQLPEKHARVLLDNSCKWRYRVLYGGRNGAKDWSFAKVALERGVRIPTRFICTREIQNTIADSIHQLLTDEIIRSGLSAYYHVTNNEIVGSNGTTFSYKGLRDLSAENIKSFEGADVCIVVEAQSLTKKSFETLDPTLRKPGSEIWIDFNTGYEDDFIYQRFVISPPENAIVAKVNYTDNPFTTQEIFDMVARAKKENDPEFENIWLGEPKRVGGRVWPAFVNKPNPNGHIREWPMEYVRDNGNCIMSIDPHGHYYPFCMWIAILPKNQRRKWPEDYYKWVYAEWPTYELLGAYYHDCRKTKFFTGALADLAKEINFCDGVSNYGLKIYKRAMDTRYATGSGSWSWSSSTEGIVNLFHRPENGGLDFYLPQVKILDSQREPIKSDLKYNVLSERSIYNEPNLYVAPWCKNTIVCLANHRFVEDSEKEDEKYKEPSDCLKILYAAMDNWEYRSPLTNEMPGQAYIPDRGYNIIAGAPANVGWMA